MRLEVAVALANGEDLKIKVDTSNIDVLDSANLPDWQPNFFNDQGQ